MTASLISIDWQQSNTFEWFVTAGAHLHRSDFGEADLAACLQSAATQAPMGNGMVEIIYRNIHMGTHTVEEILKDVDRLAKQISDRYTRLISMRH
jgi:hypothetical protein